MFNSFSAAASRRLNTVAARLFSTDGSSKSTPYDAMWQAHLAVPLRHFDAIIDDIGDEQYASLGSNYKKQNLSPAIFPSPAFPVSGSVFSSNRRLMVPLVCQMKDKPRYIWFMLHTRSPYTCISLKTVEALLGTRDTDQRIFDLRIQDESIEIQCHVSRANYQHVNILGMDALKKLNLMEAEKSSYDRIVEIDRFHSKTIMDMKEIDKKLSPDQAKKLNFMKTQSITQLLNRRIEVTEDVHKAEKEEKEPKESVDRAVESYERTARRLCSILVDAGSKMLAEVERNAKKEILKDIKPFPKDDRIEELEMELAERDEQLKESQKTVAQYEKESKEWKVKEQEQFQRMEKNELELLKLSKKMDEMKKKAMKDDEKMRMELTKKVLEAEDSLEKLADSEEEVKRLKGIVKALNKTLEEMWESSEKMTMEMAEKQKETENELEGVKKELRDAKEELERIYKEDSGEDSSFDHVDDSDN
uniref:Structural maintenance of chromosomes protein 6 n=1 Tax=Caenorhabditis tropicalis TaxID=1561998 RepID=A0A1I7UHC8_9PELO